MKTGGGIRCSGKSAMIISFESSCNYITHFIEQGELSLSNISDFIFDDTVSMNSSS